MGGEDETSEILKSMNGYDVRVVLMAIAAFHASAPMLISEVETGSSLSNLSLKRVVSPQTDRLASFCSDDSRRFDDISEADTKESVSQGSAKVSADQDSADMHPAEGEEVEVTFAVV